MDRGCPVRIGKEKVFIFMQIIIYIYKKTFSFSILIGQPLSIYTNYNLYKNFFFSCFPILAERNTFFLHLFSY